MNLKTGRYDGQRAGLYAGVEFEKRPPTAAAD